MGAKKENKNYNVCISDLANVTVKESCQMGKDWTLPFSVSQIFGTATRLPARNHLVPEEHFSNWGTCLDLRLERVESWKANF